MDVFGDDVILNVDDIALLLVRKDRAGHRVGNDRHAERRVRNLDDRETDAVEGDGALLHDEARDRVRRFDDVTDGVPVSYDIRDRAGPVDMPADDMTAEPPVGGKRSLQIDDASRLKRAEIGALQRLRHDLGNLNYTWITKQSGKVGYDYFLEPVIKALNKIGVPARRNRACDIAVGDQKIAGSARKEAGGRVLCHGTFFFETDPRAFEQSEKTALRGVTNIRGHLREDMSSGDALEKLENRTADFAVVPSPVNSRKPFESMSLFRFRDVLIRGTQYAGLKESPISFEEITRHSFICLPEGTTTRRFLDDVFSRAGINISADIELATTDIILPLVENNLGIGFIPEPIARNALASGRVREIPLVEEIPGREILLIRDPGRSVSAAASAFFAFISE